MTNKLINMQAFMDTAEWDAKTRSWSISDAQLNRLPTTDAAPVVLNMPRKPLVWGDDDHETCLCPDCGADLMGLPYGERMILQCPVCGQYLDATKIITRAEAEAAIGGDRDA